MQSGLFHSRDGTAIYYEVRGEGRPLLFCNGLLCKIEHWRHQASFLESQGYQLILFDYRGHQRSMLPRNDRNMTIEWCARDVQDLMQFLELSEVGCLGHSMGVPVLTHLAQMEPKRVKANVFVCGSVNNPFQQMLFTHRLDPVFVLSAQMNEWVPEAGALLWRKFTGKHPFAHFMASQLGFNPEVAEERDVQSYIDGVREARPEVFYRLMLDYREQDRMPLLKGIQAPTLVVAGDEDCITPIPVQVAIARLLPRGELEKISGGSHNAHMDFPQEVNGKILGFLSRVGYGGRL